MCILIPLSNSRMWTHRRSILRSVDLWDSTMTSKIETSQFWRMLSILPLSNLQISTRTDGRLSCSFKWLKQHLKIKKFWGTTENAVRIQICSAIITYCLVAIVQHDMQLKRSTYEVLQILSISLTDKTPLRDLFEKTNFNNVKELDYLLFEGLFD